MTIFSNIAQTFRSLKANRTYNIINILGLSLGLASTFILLKIVLHERNTDKFHENYENICYATLRATPSSIPNHHFTDFGKTDASDYPEIILTTGMVQVPNGEIKVDENIMKIPLTVVDSSFSKVFDFPLLHGSYQGLYSNPNSIILTKKTSEKLFGTIMSVGKTVEIVEKKLKVVGILDDLPGNSSINLQAIIPTTFYNWSRGGSQFILLQDNADINQLNEKIKFLGRDHIQFPEGIQECVPFQNLYFDSNIKDFQNDPFLHGNSKMLNVLLLIASLLFIVGTLNYLNIYLVTLQKRAKEIGILSIHGANSKYLAKYFLRENSISIGISSFLVLLIYSLISPYIPNILGKELPIFFAQDLILLGIISIILILVTSALTALRFRRISPLLYIKEISTGVKSLLGRRISTVFQYSVTLVLIIVSLFFVKQLNFMMQADMGFNSKNIICAPFFLRIRYDRQPGESDEDRKQMMQENIKKRNTLESNQQFVVDEIKKNPHVRFLSFGSSPLTCNFMPWNNMNSDLDYQDAASWAVTPHSDSLFGLKVKEGRFFDENMDKGRDSKVVINEAAKNYYEIDSISKVNFANRYWGSGWDVIGVVEDFSFDHLSKAIQPMIMFYFGDKEENELMLEVAEGKEAETIEFLRTLFNKVNPGKTFEYHFVEDELEKLYVEDKNIVRVYTLFTIIALIISSLGLFSFSIYDVQQRFKEIGIRKANGSGTWETVLYLTKNVYLLLGISFVIAIPIAWYGISKYLEGFANKAPLSWWIFALAALFTLLVSVLTVIAQSYRAATRNPVEALRYE